MVWWVRMDWETGWRLDAWIMMERLIRIVVFML